MPDFVDQAATAAFTDVVSASPEEPIRTLIGLVLADCDAAGVLLADVNPPPQAESVRAAAVARAAITARWG